MNELTNPVPPSKIKPIVFLIGVGHIGMALAQRWQKTIPEQLRLVAKNQIQQANLVKKFPDTEILLPENVLGICSGLKTQAIFVLGVRPEQLQTTLAEYKALWQEDNKPLIISITGKSTIEEISEATNGAITLKAVPNIASAYGAGCTAMLKTRTLDISHQEMAASLFSTNGSVYIFDKRPQFEIASRIAGAGLAFFFRTASLLERKHSAPFIKEALISASKQSLSQPSSAQEMEPAGNSLENIVLHLESAPDEIFLKIRDAIAKAACSLGLQPSVSEELARSALQGAASIIENCATSPQSQIIRVATPGGITEAMLRSLETPVTHQANLSALMANAIKTGILMSSGQSETVKKR